MQVNTNKIEYNRSSARVVYIQVIGILISCKQINVMDVLVQVFNSLMESGGFSPDACKQSCSLQEFLCNRGTHECVLG